MAIGSRIKGKSSESIIEIYESNEKNKDMNAILKSQEKNNNIQFNPENPKYTLDDIILPKHIKNSILDVLAYKEKSELVFNKWGLGNTHKHSRKIGINLYGDPGTGKTMAAHAIANYMNRKIIIVNYADIESKYVGETPKNIVKAFETANETNSILFFDEADAILSKRVTNMSQATDVSVNQTRSVLLTLLNDYQDIIIFATNFIQNFDPAFMRRILAHIKFELPDCECRKQIWDKLIPKEMPCDINIEYMAKTYEGISGSDISNAILLAAFKGARSKEAYVKSEYFEEAIKDIIASKKANMQTEKKVKVEDRIVSEEYVKENLKINVYK